MEAMRYPEGLKILLVDDDATCLKIIRRMLQRCQYTVTSCNKAIDALGLLRSRKEGFDLVVTDVKMPEMDGFELLQDIKLEIHTPVILMSIDNEREMAIKGIEKGAIFYLSKPIQMYDIANLWQLVASKQLSCPLDGVEVPSPSQAPLSNEERVDSWKLQSVKDAESATSHDKRDWRQHARSTNKKEVTVEGDDQASATNEAQTTSVRKQRIVWNSKLHEQFLAAINRTGMDRAVPKKILEHMKVPGVTRENIASHLQKYRLYLKKVEEAKQSIGMGLEPPYQFTGKPISGLPTPSHPQRNIIFTTHHLPSSYSTIPIHAPYSTPMQANPNPTHHHQQLNPTPPPFGGGSSSEQLPPPPHGPVDCALQPPVSTAGPSNDASGPGTSTQINLNQPWSGPNRGAGPEFSLSNFHLSTTPELLASLQALLHGDDYVPDYHREIFNEPRGGNLADVVGSPLPGSALDLPDLFFGEGKEDNYDKEAEANFDVSEYREANNPIDQ